jgi:hypothetical protein
MHSANLDPIVPRIRPGGFALMDFTAHLRRDSCVVAELEATRIASKIWPESGGPSRCSRPSGDSVSRRLCPIGWFVETAEVANYRDERLGAVYRVHVVKDVAADVATLDA